jgi:hypothetical protein
MEARRMDRGMRLAHRDVRRDGRLLQVCLPFVKHRFLDDENSVVFRQASHQVLGTLKHKVPTQVAKHDKGWHFSSSFRLGAFSLVWNSAGRKLACALGRAGFRGAGPENRNMQNSQVFP